MKLSVCMIVLNEEENISHVIGLCHTFADEIIVVDGGSTDNTVIRAKKAGEDVCYSPWKDDFLITEKYIHRLCFQ